MYECENVEKPQNDSQLNPYEYVMLNDLELFNIQAESAEIEKWSSLSTKIDNVETNRKALSSNRVKFSQLKEYVKKKINIY